MDTVEVVEIRQIRKQGPLRAFVDLKFGDLLVRDFRVMQDNGGRPYVKAPFSSYKNKNGELCFRQIIDLPDEVRGQVDTVILSAFYREREKRHEQESQ